eukprot:TRINITY_DN13_c6_g1_i1.p1 TRINITY_DN13_c6_g1~~TRINITY_DN13_c6_g1_i1.p1  ORF type:complete len:370 (-),score=105.83 TRINITY_DN13_c6_g1_i1:121-1161(-)
MSNNNNGGNKKINICLIGGGRIGTIHYNNIQKNNRFNLRFVVDFNIDRANEMAEAVSGCEGFKNLEDILDHEELCEQVDAVLVCSPTACHFDHIVNSLNKKKPVMCEKPVSVHVDQIREVYRLSDELNVPLLCGYQRRHDPSFGSLVSMLDNKEIGDLRCIRSCSRDNPVPSINFLKISAGIMHDCASHDIDVIRWISKEDPIEVYTTASCFDPEIKQLDDWDTVLCTLKMPSGVLASIDISRNAPYGYDQRIEVLGSEGMLQAENLKPTTVKKSTINGESIDPNCYSFPQRYEKTYALELDHFADIILYNVPPKVTGEDCIKTAIIADFAEQSGKLGKKLTITYD